MNTKNDISNTWDFKDIKQVYCGFAGIGKSSLAKVNDKFVDLESSNYRWLNKDDKTPNPNFVQDYKKAIDENIKNDKIVLTSLHPQIVNLLISENYNMKIVIPNLNCKDIYKQRYIDRGNDKEFIENMMNNWEKFIDMWKDNKLTISLKDDEFLIDLFQK